MELAMFMRILNNYQVLMNLLAEIEYKKLPVLIKILHFFTLLNKDMTTNIKKFQN
jgi:hypothetical protein